MLLLVNCTLSEVSIINGYLTKDLWLKNNLVKKHQKLTHEALLTDEVLDKLQSLYRSKASR
jgi:hypothetical protein